MQVLTITFIPQKSIIQAVVCFEHNNNNEHSLIRIDINNQTKKTISDLLESIDFEFHCITAMEETKKKVDIEILENKQLQELRRLDDLKKLEEVEKFNNNPNLK